MPPKIGGMQTKNGTHLHKQKIFVKIWRLVLHNAAEELSLIVDRLRTRWCSTKPHHVEREVGDFLWHFPSRLHSHQNRYTTTRPQIFYNPPCSTPPPSSSNSQFDNFVGRQGSPTLQLQQPTTTSRETMTHMYSTHFTQVSRPSFIVSFHFTTYRHDNPYWLLQYHTLRRMFYCNQHYLQR